VIGFASFVGASAIVVYLAAHPNRWIAISLALVGLAFQWRAIVHAGSEGPAELREERES
jgi:hypothetical protein